MPSQVLEQQVEFYLIKDSLSNSDTLTFISPGDSIFQFSKPDHISSPDSLYEVLINPLTVNIIPSGEYGFIPKPKTLFTPNWTVILLLSILFLLASIRSASETYIPQIFQSIFNKKAAKRLFREKVGTLVHISYRLDTLFIIMMGIFIYQVINFFSEFSQSENMIYCAMFIGLFLLFISIKFLLYRIIGAVFDISSETREFIFHAKTGNRVIGIILFPIVLFLFLYQGNIAEYLVHFGIGLVVILNIISILRSIAIIAQKVFSVYYMILYLCTLEILPLIIVWKILMLE